MHHPKIDGNRKEEEGASSGIWGTRFRSVLRLACEHALLLDFILPIVREFALWSFGGEDLRVSLIKNFTFGRLTLQNSLRGETGSIHAVYGLLSEQTLQTCSVWKQEFDYLFTIVVNHRNKNSDIFTFLDGPWKPRIFRETRLWIYTRLDYVTTGCRASAFLQIDRDELGFIRTLSPEGERANQSISIRSRESHSQC